VSDASAATGRYGWLEAVLGRGIVSARPVEQPWPTTTETTILGLEDDERVVLQMSADAAGIERRATFGRRLHEIAPQIPIPMVVAADPAGPKPWIVSAYVDGASARTMLSSLDEARRLGELVGGLVRDLASLPTGSLQAPASWRSVASLVEAASSWVASVADRLGAAESTRLAGSIAAVPASLGGVAPTLAHGDLVPVNLIVRGDALAGVLDLEAMRVAHPLFDLAWFHDTLRRHHPGAADAAIEAALRAVGAVPDVETMDRLALLAALRSLELFAGAPSSPADRQPEPSGPRFAM
jgi:aminoglycoside phosphotransferase (APT) family kinase protein